MKSWLTLLSACLVSFTALLQPLSGSYTIDPSLPAAGTNFQTFNSLKTALNTFGVTGAVLVNVKQATYNEQVNFGVIPGASALTMVTIQSNPSNVAPVILTFASAGVSDGTLMFGGGRFIKFKGITVVATGGTYRRNVFLTDGGAPNGDLYFEDCVFQGPTYTTGSTNGAHIYGATAALIGAGINFLNCDFENNSYGIYLTGGVVDRTSKLKVENCTFTGHPGYTIYATYVDSLIVTGSTLQNNSSTSIQYAIYSTNTTTSPAAYAKIEKNKIETFSTGTVYGIYLTYFNSSPLNPSSIANNMILNKATSGTGTRYGIYPLACANINIFHNSINYLDGSATLSRALYINGTTTQTSFVPGGYNILNNIIVNTGPGIAVEVESTYSSYITALNYNVYNAVGTNSFQNNSISYPTLTAWQAATGFDANSYFGDPIFFSNTNLHVQGSLANNVGTNTAGVTDDIDGQARPLAPSTTVDIGADEFVGPTCASPFNLTLLDSDTSSALIQWTAGGTETQWKLIYGPPGFTPTSNSSSVIANSNPDTITGLTPDQFYQVYIRAICGAGDTSILIGPIQFNTYGLGQFMEVSNTCSPSGFTDISTLFPANALANDGEIGIALPFPFYFQGTLVNQMTIGNNGAVVFNSLVAQISPTNTNTIATSAAVGLYPFWDDLDDANAQTFYGSIGTAPNRKYIIQWNAKHFDFTAGVPYIFQIVMEEGSGKIYYQYQNLLTGNTLYNHGAAATVGLSGINQDFALSFNNPTYLQNNNCVQFSYTNCPKPKNLILSYVLADEAALSWTAGGNESNWTVIFGPSGFDPLISGTTQSTPVNSITINGLDQLTEYDIYVYSDCTGGDQSLSLKGTFTTLPLCANPTSFSGSTDVDTIYTSWSWSPSSASYIADGFEVSYGVPGFDPLIQGTIDASDAMPGDTTINSAFFAGAVYELYLRATCDTLVSAFVGPISVTMPLTNDNVCFAETLPVDGVFRMFNNSGATIETNEQSIAPPSAGNQSTTGWGNTELDFTVWYRFIAPPSGQMRFDGSGVNFNGQFAVYEITTCNSFPSFTLVGANDDDIDGLSLAPNFTLCTLTPGAEYYLMFDSYSTFATGQYAVKLSPISLDAGTSGAVVNVCYGDTVNLFSSINSYDAGGTWLDTDGTFHIVDDTLFNTNGLASEIYEFEYKLENGCANDISVGTFEIYSLSQAGTDGTLTTCLNTPLDALAGLGGSINSGGQWFDPNNNALSSSYISAGTLNVAGTYNYLYVVGNGICPNDSSIVSINVQSTCNNLGLEEISNGEVILSPNPTEGAFVLSSSNPLNNVTIEILDINGKILETLNFDVLNEMIVNLINYEHGVYLVSLKSDQFHLVKRVQKN